MRVRSGAAGSRIIGLGHAQPERVVGNDEIARLVDTSDEWIRARTGIITRHLIGPGESVESLATDAARMTLRDARAEAHTVDLIVVATMTTTDRSPNIAGRVATALGHPGTPVLEVNTACSGFTYALALADQAIRTGTATRALVIGSEAMSQVTDWTDRTTCILTGDGAGAVLIEAAETPGISSVVWGSVPDMDQAVRIEGPQPTFAQEGRAVFRWAITEAQKHARAVVAEAGLELGDIDVFAFHQANIRIIQPIAEQLGATPEQVVITDVVDSGNTSAASIPLGLSKWWHAGRLPAGGTTLFLGFGGGFTYAGQVALLPERRRPLHDNA